MGRRILIVDDEEVVRLSLRDLLEISGYTVVGAAADGVEALEMVEAVQPDVVLMDISMPRMDGLRAAEKLMASHPLPVVFLTAHSDPATVARAGASGGYAYLVKPCGQADLAPAIETAYARFAETQRHRQDAEEVHHALETVQQLTREIAGNPNIEGVVRLALRSVARALKAPAAALLLAQGDLLRIRAHLGLDATYTMAFQVAPGESIFGEAAALGQPAQFSGTDGGQRRGPWASTVHPFGVCQSALAVPLDEPGSSTPGCLAVYRGEDEPFSATDTSVLSAFAAELAIAFHVAQARQSMAWRRWREAGGTPSVVAQDRLDGCRHHQAGDDSRK